MCEWIVSVNRRNITGIFLRIHDVNYTDKIVLSGVVQKESKFLHVASNFLNTFLSPSSMCNDVFLSKKIVGIMTTSSSAIAEKPRCSVGQFWVVITPYIMLIGLFQSNQIKSRS